MIHEWTRMDTNETGKSLPLKEEVYAVTGAAMDVHSILGAGFLEGVYQEAMAIEMTRRVIPFAEQHSFEIRYKDTILKKAYIADFFCYKQLIVEIKAMDKLSGKEGAQLLNYLKASKCKVGLLINFGNPSKLEWNRFVL